MKLPAVRSEAERVPAFAEWFSDLPGAETTWQCIHCGLCSASCPFSPYMDKTPRRLMHLAREGFKKEVLESATIWLCTSCYSCQERCPQGVSITDIMTLLKNLAVKEGHAPAGVKAQMDLIREHGRIYPLDDFDNKKRKKIDLPQLPTSCEVIKKLFKEE